MSPDDFQIQVVRLLGDIKVEAATATARAEYAVAAAKEAGDKVAGLLAERIDSMRFEMFGNGTNLGRFQMLQKVIEEEQNICRSDRKDISGRVSDLEKKATYLAGASAAGGVGIGLVLRWLASKLGVHV